MQVFCDSIGRLALSIFLERVRIKNVREHHRKSVDERSDHHGYRIKANIRESKVFRNQNFVQTFIKSCEKRNSKKRKSQFELLEELTIIPVPAKAIRLPTQNIGKASKGDRGGTDHKTVDVEWPHKNKNDRKHSEGIQDRHFAQNIEALVGSEQCHDQVVKSLSKKEDGNKKQPSPEWRLKDRPAPGGVTEKNHSGNQRHHHREGDSQIF